MKLVSTDEKMLNVSATGQTDKNTVKHVLGYSKTKGAKLTFGATGERSQFYSDSDWGNDPTGRQSFGDYCLVLGCAKLYHIILIFCASSNYRIFEEQL